MRVLAAVLLTAASVCVGMRIRDELRRRVQIRSQICLLLREIRLRARLHEPLDVQIASLSENRELDRLTFLSDCAAVARLGTPLPQAWTAAVRAFTHAHRFPRAEAQMIQQCIPALSSADGARVDGLLEWYEARAAQALQAAQTDASDGALIVRVCGAAGLLLGILIL